MPTLKIFLRIVQGSRSMPEPTNHYAEEPPRSQGTAFCCSFLDIAERFADEFSYCFPATESIDELLIPIGQPFSHYYLDTEFSLSELRAALKKCKQKNAPGEGNITYPLATLCPVYWTCHLNMRYAMRQTQRPVDQTNEEFFRLNSSHLHRIRFWWRNFKDGSVFFKLPPAERSTWVWFSHVYRISLQNINYVGYSRTSLERLCNVYCQKWALFM